MDRTVEPELSEAALADALTDQGLPLKEARLHVAVGQAELTARRLQRLFGLVVVHVHPTWKPGEWKLDAWEPFDD